MEIVDGTLYDYPKYYDLLFGSDWKAEYDFLEACFARYIRKPVHRLFEPACGTGRLLARFAQAGYEVSGVDLNEKAIAYCNERLGRLGQSDAAWVGDMTDFQVKRKVGAAFNTINSFRHLQTERAAEDHLRCMADALKRGGIYVLGLHLTPERGEPRANEESWSARKGHLAVLSHMQSLKLDRRERMERVAFHVDVYTPTRQFRIVEEMRFRTYTLRQMRSLLDRIESLALVETYDFAYNINRPTALHAKTEDVVLVLRKT